eukprot:11853419-Heterocapsa_arctica.AAC.1
MRAEVAKLEDLDRAARPIGQRIDQARARLGRAVTRCEGRDGRREGAGGARCRPRRDRRGARRACTAYGRDHDGGTSERVRHARGDRHAAAHAAALGADGRGHVGGGAGRAGTRPPHQGAAGRPCCAQGEPHPRGGHA